MIIDWVHFNEEEIGTIKIALARSRRNIEKELANARIEGHVKDLMAKLRILTAIEDKLNSAILTS